MIFTRRGNDPRLYSIVGDGLILIDETDDWEGQRKRFDLLARFNSERSRGLVHTPEWCDRMAKIQEEFDQGMTRGPA